MSKKHEKRAESKPKKKGIDLSKLKVDISAPGADVDTLYALNKDFASMMAKVDTSKWKTSPIVGMPPSLSPWYHHATSPLVQLINEKVRSWVAAAELFHYNPAPGMPRCILRPDDHRSPGRGRVGAMRTTLHEMVISGAMAHVSNPLHIATKLYDSLFTSIFRDIYDDPPVGMVPSDIGWFFCSPPTVTEHCDDPTRDATQLSVLAEYRVVRLSEVGPWEPLLGVRPSEVSPPTPVKQPLPDEAEGAMLELADLALYELRHHFTDDEHQLRVAWLVEWAEQHGFDEYARRWDK